MFEKEIIYYWINFWSTVKNDVLFCGWFTNDYDGCLDAQTSPSYVRYNKSSNTKIHQRSRKRILGGNGRSETIYLHTNYMQ